MIKIFKTIIPFIFIATISCQTQTDIISYSNEQAIDSFVIENVEDSHDLHNFAILNDSEIIAYSYMTMNLSTYIKTTKGYILKNTQAIPDTSFSHAFFIDSLNHQKCFIGFNDQILYTYSNNNFLKKFHIKLNLQYLNNEYRFFHTAENPILINDTSIVLNVCSKTPYEYLEELKEKVFAEIVIKNDSISTINYLFNHPTNLKNDIESNELFCKNREKILVLFPCIDTIYEYDRIRKQYSTHAINNFHYKPSSHYDPNRWMEADYKTKLRFENFIYQGIFFNPKTKHYVLYYRPPVNKDIKVPTFDDQEFLALILDEQFKQIKTIKFTNKFRSPASFMLTQNGIAMPLFTKNYKHEKTYSYYIFDL
jgi:hypothetical protein